MKRPAFALLGLPVALLASCGAAKPTGWTDRQYEFALDGMRVVDVPIKEAVYKNDRIRHELQRIGVTAGCPIVATAIVRAEQARFDEYHGWALPALKSIAPAEATAGFPPGSIAPAGPYQNSGRLLLNRLEHEKPDFLPEIITMSLDSALAAFNHEPAVDQDWRGRFSDWDFARLDGLAYRIACSVETSKQPDRAKLTFDNIYQSRGN